MGVLEVVGPDDTVAVCKRVDDMTSPPVPGSTMRPCGSCQQDCYVAPTTRDLLERDFFDQLLCLQCFTLAVELLSPPLPEW